MPFSIIRNDITKMKVDAIVNAANTALSQGGGVCGAIFKAAGADQLQAACDRLAPIQTGEAVLTPGFDLPARCIIHTAGPVYQDGRHGEEKQLQACYQNSLQLAAENNCGSIAFPLISSGIYGYPKELALQVATDTIQAFLEQHELDVYLVVFDQASFVISEKLLGDVASYISEHYVDQHTDIRRRQNRRTELNSPMLMEEEQSRYAPDAALRRADIAPEAEESKSLDDHIGRLDEPFSAALLRLIDAKGKTDVEVYKKANLDRRLFSKIRTGKSYIPGKRNVLALAVALELKLDETEDLLKRAGYALSHSQVFDVIVEYFIISGTYDIYQINQVLFKYDQQLLGG